MIPFDSHPECQDCTLCQSAVNPGLPSRQWSQKTDKRRALIFLGQSPGHHEDKKNQIFIGYSGQLLDKMIEHAKLTDYVDVFLANALRCKPPQGANETQSQMRACRKHLIADIERLEAWGYEEIIIFALGAKACYSILNKSSLAESLKHQAARACLPHKIPEENPRVFCTFHPAILHPLREPGKIRAVETHFSLLLRYLKGEFIPNELVVTPELYAEVPNDISGGRVTVDIETYGILQGKEQTVFQPVKSLVVDGIPLNEQTVTVSFGYRDKENKVRTAQYIWQYPAHRKRIRQWFERISWNKITCTGQNIKFDLAYLRNDTSLAFWIDPRRLIVDDTLLMSFLLYEQQPEKGLKELSTLFGIVDYSKSLVTGKMGNAKSCNDKNLHYYNCLDAAATLVLMEELERRIGERYDSNNWKLGPVCKWVRNMAIWNTLDLDTNGSALLLPKLEAFHKQESERCQELLKSAEEEYGIKLAGTGSDAPLRQLMLDCIAEADMMNDSRVEWTKTGSISIGVENVNLVTPNMPDGRNKEVLTMFQEYKEHSKIVSTYTRPLLESPRKGIVTRNGDVGIAYPSWYPVPLYANRGGSSDDKSGGQIQGRYSCQKPARQTEPKSIRACSCSRWPGGRLVEFDVSQDHLRMAALLSGDPELMGAYQIEGESIHLRTAATIFPEDFGPNFKKEHPKKYTLSKNLNFLVLFKGGAGAYQSEAREKVGVELPIEFCYQAIQTWYHKHHIYAEWQNEMIRLAAKQGYIMLPTGWSRTFGLGPQNIAGQQGEVLNFLHQCPCAQITQSSHYQIKREFLKYHLRSLVCLNIYDANYIDIYPGEYDNVMEIAGEAMTHPPLLPIFERWVDRTIPWRYETKEYKHGAKKN